MDMLGRVFTSMNKGLSSYRVRLGVAKKKKKIEKVRERERGKPGDSIPLTGLFGEKSSIILRFLNESLACETTMRVYMTCT